MTIAWDGLTKFLDAVPHGGVASPSCGSPTLCGRKVTMTPPIVPIAHRHQLAVCRLAFAAGLALAGCLQDDKSEAELDKAIAAAAVADVATNGLDVETSDLDVETNALDGETSGPQAETSAMSDDVAGEIAPDATAETVAETLADVPAEVSPDTAPTPRPR